MRRTLTIALVLAVVLSAAGGSRAEVSAHRDAQRAGDTGGGVIRKGPIVNSVTGAALTVQVPSTADIFLAGRSYPFSVRGKSGTDLAVRNGPACVRIQVSAGQVITISTKYNTAHGPSAPRAANADGDTGQIVTAGPAEVQGLRLGLSSLRAPIDSLVGVFIGAKPNTGRAPANLDFGKGAARDTITIRPALNQVFFIGRGVNNRNISKRYIIPNGARSLCLGSLDHLGGNHDNHGLILAFVSGAQPPPPQPILQPIPSATATATQTATPVAPTSTATPLVYPTDTVTNTPTLTFTLTPTPTFTLTPTPSFTLTPTLTWTPVPTNTLTNTPTLTFTVTPTPTFPFVPTVTNTPLITNTPTPRGR